MPTPEPSSTATPATNAAVKRPASRRTATPRKQTAAAKSVGAIKPSVQVVSGAPKQKLVRDSFTIPKSEFEVLSALKQRAATLVRPTKKSELLRAGIALLNRLTDKAFLAALDSVPSLKTGRPKSSAPIVKAKVAKKA